MNILGNAYKCLPPLLPLYVYFSTGMYVFRDTFHRYYNFLTHPLWTCSTTKVRFRHFCDISYSVNTNDVRNLLYDYVKNCNIYTVQLPSSKILLVHKYDALVARKKMKHCNLYFLRFLKEAV